MCSRWKLFVLTQAFLFIACATSKQTSEQVPDKGVSVTVEDARELDGCTFLLLTADGKKLQPVNLDVRYHKAGMILSITYKKVDRMSVCMSGTMVELLSVEKKN